MIIDIRNFRLNGDILEYQGIGTAYSLYEREDSYMIEIVTYNEDTGRKITKFRNTSTLSEAVTIIEESEAAELEKIRAENLAVRARSGKNKRGRRLVA